MLRHILTFLLILPSIFLKSIEQLDQFDGLVQINRDKMATLKQLASKNEYSMIALFDEDIINRNDVQLTKNMQQAILYLQKNVKEGYSGDINLIVNRVKISEYKESEVKLYYIYSHSLPKFLFFSNYGSTFTVYKGGKSETMIRAWIQRNTRKIKNQEHKFKSAYQFNKKVYFFFFGDTDTELYRHLDSNYWQKKTKLPIYHLMDYALLSNIPCQGTNKTEQNFVLLISKNSTNSPCFCLSADTIETTNYLIGNLTEHVVKTPELDDLKQKEIKFIKPYMVPLFEKKEQYFLLMTDQVNNTNPQFEIYKEFCQSIKTQCFYALNSGVRPRETDIELDISTFSEYFLGYTEEDAKESTIPYLFYIDNTVAFPSIKYKVKGPFDNSGQMNRFRKAILDKQWENFYVSEPEINNPDNGSRGVLAVTKNNYKQEIKKFKGDVILVLVNSQHMSKENSSYDLKMLRMTYKLAQKVKYIEGGKNIKFLAIDILKNDLPEFRGYGSPTFLLYDYINKQQTKINMFDDVDMSLNGLQKQAPVFSDPNME